MLNLNHWLPGVPALKLVVTSTVLLFAWMTLIASLVSLGARLWAWLRRRVVTPETALTLAGGEHWLLLGIAALLYVVR